MTKIKNIFSQVKKLALLHPIWILISASILSTSLLYFPFIFHLNSFCGLKYPEKFNFSTILLNFDSLNYIIVAKTWYNPQKIAALFPNTLSPNYFPAHFPAYPALIWLTAQIPTIDFPHASVIITLITSITAVIAFYYLSTLILKDKKKALILSLLFTLFPARWLVVKNVPSPEPLFITFIITSIYFFCKRKYGKSALLAILCQTVKSPGILLAGSLGLAAIIKIYQEKTNLKKAIKKFWPVLITPLGLMAVFYLYKLTTGNFFAYFKTGNNIHLFWPPFQVFNFHGEWTQSIWLEDVYFIYLAGLILLFELWRKYKTDILFLFPAVFYLSTCFIAHRDISRYLLPAVPFLLLGGEKIFTNKRFLIPFLILLPALYLYATNFISFNIMPLSDWTPYL